MSTEHNFEGQLASESLNGGVTITVGPDALSFFSSFDQLACMYTDIRSFALVNYALVIDTEFGRLRLSQLGGELEWLHDKLWDAYNDAVQKSLFVDGASIYESHGDYRYEDSGGRSEGCAQVRLFGNCVCLFPPNEDARRVPFCFLREMQEENYSLRLTLDSGDNYTFVRIGGYKPGFVHQLTTALRAFQQKNQDNVREIGGSLNSAQVTTLARLMPEGVAAPVGEMDSIAPAFVSTLEGQIAQSRAAEPYVYFQELCGKAGLCVGIKPSSGAGEPEYDIFIATAKEASEGGVAAVEFAMAGEETSATFFYRYEGAWTNFVRTLNRAMEAVNFRREIIWLREDALNKPENAHYRMAIRRTEALRFLRSCFSGRAIHSTPEAWRRETERLMGISGP